MAFSETTMMAMTAVAERCKAMWQWAEERAFEWTAFLGFLLDFLIKACGGQSEEEVLKNLAQKCAANGVGGCIEASMSAVRAKKVRKRMAKRFKVTTKLEQDRRFFTAVMSANADRELAYRGIDHANDNDERDDEEKDE